MPPKARGRGGRGRGTGRGGAASNRPAAGSPADAEATPPNQPTQTTAAEPSEPMVVPKQENDGIGSTLAPDSQISTTIETQPTTSVAASSAASPQTPSEPPTRVPRQRLESLKSTEPPSRSASPAVRRGTSSRGKKPVALPTFTGRRSKEERDARTKADRERERERQKQLEKMALKKENEAKRNNRGAPRGRGGYSGAVSGPFSMGSASKDRASKARSLGPSGYGSGSGSGSRATRVKREADEAGPSRTHKSSGASIKKEDAAYISSSDDEEDAEFPRKDIDLIELSSDEDEAEPSGRKDRMALPIRIGRKEHKERVIGINTEASSETSAKMLQQAEAKGSTPTADVLRSSSRKGKGKTKDVEITSVRKTYKGVWQDGSEPEVQVKAEPVSSDDEDMADAEQIGMGAPSAKDEEQSPDAERKPKIRLHGEPNFQTEDERAEWMRFQSNLEHIRAELGPEVAPGLDAAGDVNMIDTAANASKPSVRDNNVYLFQIPPIMPDLLLPGVKKESSDPRPSAAEPVPTAKGEAVHIKTEEGLLNALAKVPERPRFASGRVGKLQVHQSGRTILNWGGTGYELTPGTRASFLQEVISVHTVPEKERSAPEDAGDAISFGRVKGKFVVTPDFSQLFK